MTAYQMKKFKLNQSAYEVFSSVVASMKDDSKVTNQYIIDFLNNIEELKVDLIASISNLFFEEIPFIYCEKILKEILQMEMDSFERMFFNKDSINLNDMMELDELRIFILTQSPSEAILSQYAKHVGVY